MNLGSQGCGWGEEEEEEEEEEEKKKKKKVFECMGVWVREG